MSRRFPGEERKQEAVLHGWFASNMKSTATLAVVAPVLEPISTSLEKDHRQFLLLVFAWFFVCFFETP